MLLRSLSAASTIGVGTSSSLTSLRLPFLISSSFSDFSKGKSTVFNDDGSVKDFKPLDFQARLDAMLKPNQPEPKKHLNVHSDGPMGVGIISQDALKDYRPSISTYVLQSDARMLGNSMIQGLTISVDDQFLLFPSLSFSFLLFPSLSFSPLLF